jgi:hypothetical protein
MDRKLAKQNLRQALLWSIFGLFMFGITFVAAIVYNAA